MNLPNIRERHLEYLKNKIGGEKLQNNLRASSVGFPCDRKHYYDLTLPHPPHSVELQSIFDEGNVHETSVEKTLREMDFVVEGMQKDFRIDDPLITGRIDGMIGLPGEKMYPFDTKSISQWGFEEINSAEDLIHSKKHWHKLYPIQIMAYMYMTNSEYGCLVFKNKQTGMLKDIWFSFNEHVSALDATFKRAKRVYENVKKKTEGDPCGNMELCSQCPWKETCLPDIIYKGGAKIIESPELVGLLEIREKTKESHKEYGQVDGRIKKMLKELPSGEKMAGDFVIQIKDAHRDAYSVDAQDFKRIAIAKVKA